MNFLTISDLCGHATWSGSFTVSLLNEIYLLCHLNLLNEVKQCAATFTCVSQYYFEPFSTHFVNQFNCYSANQIEWFDYKYWIS